MNAELTDDGYIVTQPGGGIGLTDGERAKLQEIDNKVDLALFQSHTSDESNPHSVDKEQVGLANADNTADASKPVSAPVADALASLGNQVALVGTAASAAQTAANNALDRANHTGTQAPSTLSAGGAVSGDGLVWNGTIWVPSRAFAYDDLLSFEASKAGGENYNATFLLDGAYSTYEWAAAIASSTAITLNRSVSAPGSGGSLRVIDARAINCAGFVGMNPSREYRFVLTARGDAANVNVHGAYAYCRFFDADKLEILSHQAAYTGSTLTELTSALADGDTVINVASTANWSASAYASLRSLVLWRDIGGGKFAYTGVNGKIYDHLGYTRYARSAAYNAAGITGTTLPLTVPWSLGGFPAGTKIANSAAGSAGLYYLENTLIANGDAWTVRVSGWRKGVASPTSISLRADGGSAAMWQGASYAKVGALIGYNNESTTEISYLSGLVLESRPG